MLIFTAPYGAADSSPAGIAYTRVHTPPSQHTRYLGPGLSLTSAQASVCFLSLSHTHMLKESLSTVLWELERCPMYFCIYFWCPAPPLHSFSEPQICCRFVCVSVCVFSMCYLVIDYKRLFNFISPHVGINLHSLSGVNGVSRWLARKIFEDCRLAGVCIQPPALFLLIDLLLPFLFSGCFGFSSF